MIAPKSWSDEIQNKPPINMSGSKAPGRTRTLPGKIPSATAWNYASPPRLAWKI